MKRRADRAPVRRAKSEESDVASRPAKRAKTTVPSSQEGSALSQSNLLSFFKAKGLKPEKPRLEIAYDLPPEKKKKKTTKEEEERKDEEVVEEKEATEAAAEESIDSTKSAAAEHPLMAAMRKASATRLAGPVGWKEVWNRIVEFRAHNKGPVDSMGCGSMARSSRPEDQRFQTLLGLMLSRDQMTDKAMRQLQEGLGGVVSVEAVRSASVEQISSLIKPVTYYTLKAVNIKKVADICHQRYNDDIPSTFKGLTDLPGVGPKMSHLCLQFAWNKTEGIGVDTHVHRISNRLGWVRSNNPEATRKQLEEWLPREHWKTINNLFVGFGQLICNPIYPKCAICPVNDLCPTGRANLSRGSPAVER